MSDRPIPTRRPRLPLTRRPLALLAAPLLAAALAYGAAADGEFLLDDYASIQANWSLRRPVELLGAVGPLALLGPGRPVTQATFALDYALHGLSPLAFHLTSLLLHLGAAWLAFLLSRRLLRDAGHLRADGLAVLVAGAWACHPLATEAVCYASQRSEVLAALLSLGALLLLARALAAWPARRAWLEAAAATALTLLALGAKSVAVVVPAAFLLHAATTAGGAQDAPPLIRRLGRALALSAGAWALAAAATGWTLLELDVPGSTAGLSSGALGPWRYLATQLWVHWWYAGLAFWPVGLSFDHAVTPAAGLLAPAALLGGLASIATLLGAAWLAVRARRGGGGAPGARAAAFGLGWWYLWLGPTSSIIPIDDLMAEHRTYLALLGLLLAAVVGADALVQRLGARWGLAAPAALGLGALAWAGLLGLTAARAQDWRSPVALWSSAAAQAPHLHRPTASLALALARAGRPGEALAAYGRALALARSPWQYASTARNLAGLHLASGRAGEALAVLERAAALAPADHELQVARAVALRDLGRPAEALQAATAAVTLAPGQPAAWDVLGLAHYALGQDDQALRAFEAARGIDPGGELYVEHAFMSRFRLGRGAEACADWGRLRTMGGPRDASLVGWKTLLGCPGP